MKGSIGVPLAFLSGLFLSLRLHPLRLRSDRLEEKGNNFIRSFVGRLIGLIERSIVKATS